MNELAPVLGQIVHLNVAEATLGQVLNVPEHHSATRHRQYSVQH